MGEPIFESERSPAAGSRSEYAKPILNEHGRLQTFTAADGAPTPVSGTRHDIPTDTPSDVRLKSGIEPLADGALAQVMALRPVEFSWIDTGARQAGFIAQEVETVMAQALARRPGSDLRHIDYAAIIALLTKAVQELQAEVAELRSAAEKRSQ